ncbi:hypothetical protein BH23PLA1_BH23PLA1_20830 [soil metagenome]
MGEVMKVLLVEDAALLRYAFGRLLRMNGFIVRETTNGREAMDCLLEFRPHVVLTDLMMPIMDGVELIRRIRSDPTASKTPVVAITADATERATRLAREAGATDVIVKPIDLPELLERLGRIDIVAETNGIAPCPNSLSTGEECQKDVLEDHEDHQAEDEQDSEIQ